MNKNYQNILSITAVVICLTILIQVTLIDTSYALTKFYNCVTRVVNKNGTVSVENTKTCYDKVFKGAQGPDEYARLIKSNSWIDIFSNKP